MQSLNFPVRRIVARFFVGATGVLAAWGGLALTSTSTTVGVSSARAVVCERTDVPTLKARGEPVPGRVWCVLPHMSDRKLDQVADDVSAIACVSETLCIAASDETRFAEVVRLDREDFTMSPERYVYLEDTEISKMGNDKKSVKELDIEAAAAVGNTVVLIGSHGRSRNGSTQAARFGVYTFSLSEATLDDWSAKRSPDDAERLRSKGVKRLGGDTDPLSDGMIAQLLAQVEMGKSMPLTNAWDHCLQQNGFNIEGLAISGSRIFIGMRGPIQHSRVFVLSAELNAFLKDEVKGAMVHEIPVMNGSGIRAIEPLDDGFLVLTGTSQVDKAIKGECSEAEIQEAVQPALYFWGGKQDPDTVAPLALFTKKTLKPEGLKLLRRDREKSEIELLVFFDGETSGAPVSYRIPFDG